MHGISNIVVVVVVVSFRERHCHPWVDCFHIPTATWQHHLQLPHLSPPVLQPLRSPETTVFAALSLGHDSALIRCPPPSPQAKTCLQPDCLPIHSLSCSNQAAESQVRCPTIPVTKLSPSRRLLHLIPMLRVPLINCKTCMILEVDLINHLIHHYRRNNCFSFYMWWTLCYG